MVIKECLIFITSHKREFVVLLFAIFIGILIPITIFLIIVTALSVQFPNLFNNWSNAVGIAGIVLALAALIFYFLDKLVAQNRELESSPQGSNCDEEFMKQLNKKLDEKFAALEKNLIGNLKEFKKIE